MQSLAEQTQGALNRLRSAEFNMKIVQLQQPSPANPTGVVSSSEIDIAASIWRGRNATTASVSSVHSATTASPSSASSGSPPSSASVPSLISLPSSLLDYYKSLQTDGLHFAAAAVRCANTSGVEPSAYVCCCKLNSIGGIVAAHVDESLIQPARSATQPTSPTSASVGSPRGRTRCFLLAAGISDATHGTSGVDGPREILCDVLLVYRERGPHNNPEVWGRNIHTGKCFYLCRCVEDYLRLSCRMFWVAGWQLCFDEDGPPEWCLPWLRVLAPGPLLAALQA